MMSSAAASIESDRRNCPHSEDRVRWCTLWPWPDHLTTCARNIFGGCCPAELADRWEWRPVLANIMELHEIVLEEEARGDTIIRLMFWFDCWRYLHDVVGWSPLPPWRERLLAGESP